MNSLAIVSNTVVMSSREIADLLEKQHANIKISAERLAEKGVIGTIAVQEFVHNGNTYTEYMLNKRDSLILVAQNCPEFTARIVDRWQELEAGLVPALPRTYADALRQLASEVEAKEHAEHKARIAEATKAEIGSRREATAMNTASQAAKKAKQLEIELDKSKEYASVKRMELLYHGTRFNWRLLKSAAAEMDVPPIDVFDANYGTVKAYHADVWMEAYAVSINAERD